MRKLVIVIAPPLVGLLAWLFLSWPELPGRQQSGAEAGIAVAGQREADGPAGVVVKDAASAGTPDKALAQASQDRLPSTADVSPTEPAAVDASESDSAGLSAPPGARLAELQRRALAGEPKAMRDWLDALKQCGKVFAPPHHPDAARYVDLLSEDWLRAGSSMRCRCWLPWPTTVVRSFRSNTSGACGSVGGPYGPRPSPPLWQWTIRWHEWFKITCKCAGRSPPSNGPGGRPWPPWIPLTRIPWWNWAAERITCGASTPRPRGCWWPAISASTVPPTAR